MPIVTFTYKGQSFKVVGTRKVGESWEHCVKCIGTGEYKWKADNWMEKITALAMEVLK